MKSTFVALLACVAVVMGPLVGSVSAQTPPLYGQSSQSSTAQPTQPIGPPPQQPYGAQQAPDASAGGQSNLAGAPRSDAPRAPVAQNSDYALGAGDQIRVTVFGEPELTGDYIIGAQGTIAYALVGEVPLAGLRTDEAAGAIADRLRGTFLHDPRVSVAVLAYRPFYILGEVQRPGAYPYSPDLSIMGAIATAGGFTYRANRRVAFISEPRGHERRVMVSGAVQIRPGDTIRITERWF